MTKFQSVTDREVSMRWPLNLRIAFFAILLCVAGLASAQQSISVTVGEWPPYVSQNLADYGIAPRITAAAFKAVGVEASFVFLPWMRAFEKAKDGEYDATLLWVRTAEREKDFVFSDIVITGKAVFFHLKSKPFAWKTMSDLVGLNIGGLTSGSYPWFDTAIHAGIKLKMDRADDEVTNFKKLLGGRIDILSLDQLTGTSVLEKNFSPAEVASISFDPTPIESWDYCLMFSKKSAKTGRMVDLFNQGLRKIKQSGDYARLADQ
jgi:ABC-type amino acid transport/signal transduction systems, periplasmic component/domain